MSMFKEPGGTETNESVDPKTLLNGGPDELKVASEHGQNGRWAESLDVLNNILNLPADPKAAIAKLQAVLENPAPVAADVSFQGRAESGEHIGTVKLKLSGGVVPDLFAMRGQCIWQLILEVMKRNNNEPEAVFSDPDFESLIGVGTLHAHITTQTVADHTEAMYYAGMVCLSCQQPAPAAQIFQHVLQMDPQHEGAASMLPVAENAARARGEIE